MKQSIFFIFLILFLFNYSAAQDSLSNGNWANKYELLRNTPEAALMVRTGDIDNLGFGWPVGFNPFSGANTPSHGYPWAADTIDPSGTDRIMVITSYTGSPPAGRDGYTAGTSRPENSVRPITLNYELDGLLIQSAMLQIFVDDFQASLWKAQYQVLMDGVRIPGLEIIINDLIQTGPIGRIIKYEVPETYLYLLEDGKLEIVFDDYTTGAGDGYAIDFIKLLINPSLDRNYGTITGTIKDQTTSLFLDSVKVVANGSVTAFSGTDGTYMIDSVFTGLITVQTFLPGYGSQTKTVIIEEGQTENVDFFLISPAPEVVSIWPEVDAFNVSLSDSITVEFDVAIDTATVNLFSFYVQAGDSSIPGSFYFDSTSIVFTPHNNFMENTEYRVTLNTNITNLLGVPVSQNISWKFSTGAPTAIGKLETSAPRAFDLFPAYPNPFNPSTRLRYNLYKSGRVQIGVYDLTGRMVKELIVQNQSIGNHSVSIDGSGLSSGIYFVRVRSAAFVKTQKIALIK